MLQMKKTRKSEKKKLENFAPKRDDISTKFKPEEKIQKAGAFVKRRLSTEEKLNESENVEEKSKKLKKITTTNKDKSKNKKNKMKTKNAQ